MDIAIRPIRPDDKRALQDGVEHLSTETAYRRFMSPKPRLTGGELRYLTEIDGRDHAALVATPATRDDVIIGVARYVRDPERPWQAEAAVVIGDPYQRRGLGTRLGTELAALAEANGIVHFTATMLPENRPAARLLDTLNARLAYGTATAAA